MGKEVYESKLGIIETERAIKNLKDNFERNLANALNLTRVSAPLFVKRSTGLNDDLNGVERKVSFTMLNDDEEIEIVQSLAKWKRMALGEYGFVVGTGLYTDMNAIRRDEELDNLHSIYVDQWDWEKVIREEDRNEEYLKDTVNAIYEVLRGTEEALSKEYDYIKKNLPEKIFFITSEELMKKYPNDNSKERERKICKEYGAVFIMKIGGKLSNGEKHDGRAPDYDDWELNGDILFYYDVLDLAFEVSSMGIRVDKKSLAKQLTARNQLEKLSLPYQKSILEDKVPLTIGGGIGQSRICMFFLRKAHIGEVQASVWDDKNLEWCKENKINLL